MLVWPFGSPSLPRSTVKRTLSPTPATGGELRHARSRAGRTDLRPHGRLTSNAAQRQSSDASSATWVRSAIVVPAGPLRRHLSWNSPRALLAIGVNSGRGLEARRGGGSAEELFTLDCDPPAHPRPLRPAMRMQSAAPARTPPKRSSVCGSEGARQSGRPRPHQSRHAASRASPRRTARPGYGSWLGLGLG